jgi:putative copper resistance protein D
VTGGLAPVDAAALLAVAAKAAGYGCALLAIGGVVFVATLRDIAGGDAVRLARRLAASAALLGVALLVPAFGIRAARLSGEGLAGAADPLLLGLLWQGPLGDAASWRVAGYAAVAAILVPGRAGLGTALAGCALVALSFAQIGHTLDLRRAAAVPLLALHLLVAGLWIGSLVPLHRAAASGSGAAPLMRRSGTLAMGAVAALFLAGLALSAMLLGSPRALVSTGYGLVLLTKLGSVAALLGLAALNRLRLVPALAAGRPGATRALRRSIAWEGAVAALVLLLTATLTTLAAPPAG